MYNYDEPEIHTENEVELLSHAVTKMAEDMQGYVKDILSAEAKSDQMEGLAIKDALTGIRNKTGYDREVAKLEKTMSGDPELAFGILENYAADENLKPWEKISASIGYTVYDPKQDTCVEDVFKRADKEMYKCKEEMHAVRE